MGELAMAFIVLKLCGIIDWAWPWVLAPLWVLLALFAAAVVVALVTAAVADK